MSGINELKKKAKMSLDEMYDSPTIVVEEIQVNGKPENHLNRHFESNPFKKGFSEDQIEKRTESEHTKQGGSDQTHISSQKTISQTYEQPTQKTPTFKMTFNLSEKAYTTFNNLYAHRMLKGRKTEKSEMICEAIQWLLEVDQLRESTMGGEGQVTNEVLERLARSFKSF